MLTRSRAKLDINPSNNNRSMVDSASNMSPNPTGQATVQASGAAVKQLRVKRERMNRQREEWESLRLRMIAETRETNERQERELLRLREENDLLRNASSVAEGSNTNTGLLSGLVNGIQLMNLNVRPPRFGNDLMANPNEFMEQVEKYFLIKKV